MHASSIISVIGEISGLIFFRIGLTADYADGADGMHASSIISVISVISGCVH
jgi:hypothetical protein